jgi:hypothetical protein
VLFRETQRFRQWLIWALVLFTAILSLYGAFQQLILGIPFGSNPAPDGWMIVIAVIFGIGFPIFMYMINLTAEVRSDGLYIRYFPFHLSFIRIKMQEIKEFEACTYSPLGDYGGWGIRSSKKGKVYNVSGNRGVQLELANGKRLLIGSQKPEEFVETLTSINRRPMIS